MDWFPVSRREKELQSELDFVKETVRDLVRINDRVYFDRDRNLVFQHECLGTVAQTVLDGWSLDSHGYVRPSIACVRCGAHLVVFVQMRMESYEKMVVPWKDIAQMQPDFIYQLREEHDGSGSSSDPEAEWDRDVRVERGSGGEADGTGGVRDADAHRAVHGVGDGHTEPLDAGADVP